VTHKSDAAFLKEQRNKLHTNSTFSAQGDLAYAWRAFGRWLDSFQGQTAFAVVIAIVYTLGYLGDPALPGNNDAYCAGWLGWWDQSLYFKTAAAISSGELSAATYFYPLGYPFLGALTWQAAPRHAFFVPDLFLTVGIALLFYRIVRRFLSPQETLLLIASFVFLYRGTLSDGLVEPWSTIPTHFFGYVMVVLLVVSRPTNRRIYLSATCVGMTYVCRVAEAACLLPLLGAAILYLPTWRRRIMAGLGASGIILLFVLTMALLHYRMFGSLTSPYEASARPGQAFGAFPMKWKMYSLFVDGHLFFRETEPMLLRHYPWFLLCVPGAAIVVHRFGLRGFGMVCSIVATYVLYFAFNDFWPRNIYRFHVIHYLVWTLPLIMLFAYIGVRDGWRIPRIRWSLLSIPAVGVFLLCYRLVEVPLERIEAAGPQMEIPSQISRRPDWLVFIGAAQRPKLFSGGRELQDFVDYVPRFDGMAVLLGPHVKMPIAVNAAEGKLTAVETGQLRSRFELPTRIPGLSIVAPSGPSRIYGLGTTIEFGKQGDAKRFCGRGWSQPEDQLTWTEGESAIMVLGVPASQPFMLRATMAGLVKGPELPFQPTAVFANGKKIADWQVSEKKEYTAKIPGLVTVGGELLLEFQTPKATTPKSLGINEDTRVLGVAMFTISIEKSSEWKK
jgi:hypothetical protein